MLASDKKLMNHAEKINDALLMKVACGRASIWEYLSNYIEAEDLGKIAINDATKRTIGTSFKNNQKRRVQLSKWINDEKKVENPTKIDSTILEMYEKEAEILDAYAFSILCDFLNC